MFSKIQSLQPKCEYVPRCSGQKALKESYSILFIVNLKNTRIYLNSSVSVTLQRVVTLNTICLIHNGNKQELNKIINTLKINNDKSETITKAIYR